MYAVISGPPPCTTTGFMPTYFMSTMSLATSSRSAGSAIAAPPYLMTTVRPHVVLDPRQRLDERARLGEQVSHRSSGRLASGPVLAVDPHVLVAQVAVQKRRPRSRRRGAGRRRCRSRLPRAPRAPRPRRRAPRCRRAQTSMPAKVMSSARGSSAAPDLPTAMATRPQFASPPNNAVLTSGEFATARAARSASASLAAPPHRDRDELVAPSPSRTIMRASSPQTLAIAAATAANAGSCSARSASPPAAPLAMSTHRVVGRGVRVDGDPVEGRVDRRAAAPRRRPRA